LLTRRRRWKATRKEHEQKESTGKDAEDQEFAVCHHTSIKYFRRTMKVEVLQKGVFERLTLIDSSYHPRRRRQEQLNGQVTQYPCVRAT